MLDTLFLASPISFRGRVIQQVGRIMRDTEARNRMSSSAIDLAVSREAAQRPEPITVRVVRDGAKGQGIAVAERGRLPAAVWDQFRAAHR